MTTYVIGLTVLLFIFLRAVYRDYQEASHIREARRTTYKKYLYQEAERQVTIREAREGVYSG
jgi:hypothetical protein